MLNSLYKTNVRDIKTFYIHTTVLDQRLKAEIILLDGRKKCVILDPWQTKELALPISPTNDGTSKVTPSRAWAIWEPEEVIINVKDVLSKIFD